MPFRSLGTYAVWFPRGLLLRLASRLACRKLIESWLCTDEANLAIAELPSKIEACCQDILNEIDFSPQSLTARIEEETRKAHLTELGATPAEAVTGALGNLQDQTLQTIAYDDPGNWARQALNRIREWVGGDEGTGDFHNWRKTRVNRALHAAAQKVAGRCAKKLTAALAKVTEIPGARIAAIEKAIEYIERFCEEQQAAVKRNLDQERVKTRQSWTKVEIAIDDCATGGGGFRLFGGRTIRRLLSGFMSALTAFARQRLKEENLSALGQFYIALMGEMKDQHRDLGFCRQRLRHLQENLDAMPVIEGEDLTATRPGADYTVTHSPLPSTEAYWEAIRQSNTARVVLPDGEEDLEKAAIRLLQRLSDRDWLQLDKDLQDRVLGTLGGIHKACMKSGDLTRALAAPLIDETINLLRDYLPMMDVAQILSTEFGFSFDEQNNLHGSPSQTELQSHAQEYLNRAAPLQGRSEAEYGHSFVLIPASEAGKRLSQAMEAAVPRLKHVSVPGQSDLMVCRDVGPLTVRELRRFLKMCGKAYHARAMVPSNSPHARFDLVDWMPLDP